MSAERNRKTTEEIYAAFGRGDVPFILNKLSADVAWEAWSDNFAQRAGVPWLQPRKGRAGAAAFFEYIASWKIARFDVLSIMAGGANVAVEISNDMTVTQTGARLLEEEMHLWTFDESGAVIRFRHYVDTARHIAAATTAR